MNSRLRVLLIIAIFIYFMIIFFFLKRKSLTLKYSLMWISMGIIMFILVIFPSLLGVIKNLTGIGSEMNALFAILIFLILIIIMALTSIVSKQSNKIKILNQNNALLEKKIHDILRKKEG